MFSKTIALKCLFYQHFTFFLCKKGTIAITFSLFFILLNMFVPILSANEKQDTHKDPTLILESANSNENHYTNGEFVSILRGNVVFSYDNSRILADEATWWRSNGIIQFRNNIIVTNESQIMTCDHLNFTKDNSLLTATGHFNYTDTLEQATLTGNNARYYLDEKRFILTGNPRLIRYDTSSTDTLTISGITMSYIDSLKRATVTDNVKISKGLLSSSCKIAHYFTDKNIAHLRKQPKVTYDKSLVDGDSINLHFGKETLTKASVYGNAHGTYVDTSTSTSDTTFTHIRGDSLVLSISDSGIIDTLWTFGKARSEYYSSNEPDIVNEANGKEMIMAFGSKGSIKNIKVAKNARSRYFIEEQNSKGVNEASGDSIIVEFSNGKASHLTLSGSARGFYVPQDL